MRSRLTYESATGAHAEYVGSHMREADRLEVRAATGLDATFGCRLSLRASSVAVTALWDGEPVGVFGVVPTSTIDGIGSPWMLGTDRAAALAREWLVEAPQWLRLISDGYVLLRNHVDARNVRSRLWLRRMGFVIHPAEPFGVQGLAFHPFERQL